jgi:hypothetical protein
MLFGNQPISRAIFSNAPIAAHSVNPVKGDRTEHRMLRRVSAREEIFALFIPFKYVPLRAGFLESR